MCAAVRLAPIFSTFLLTISHFPICMPNIAMTFHAPSIRRRHGTSIYGEYRGPWNCWAPFVFGLWRNFQL